MVGAEDVELESASPDLRRLRALISSKKWDEALRLLEVDASLWHRVDEDGVSHLHWAALDGSATFARSALEAGCALEQRSPQTLQTPLMWAVVKGKTEVAHVLLEAGADPFASDALGATPAMLAVQYSQIAALLLLLSRGQRERQLASLDNKGCSLAHWAAYKGEPETLRVLAFFGADLLAVDAERKTPLHRAIQGVRLLEEEPKRAEAVEMLVEQGGDVELQDADGKTCLDLAAGKHGNWAPRIRAALTSSQGPGSAADVASDLEAGRSLNKPSPKKDDAKRQKPKHGPALFWLVNVSLAVFQYLLHVRETAWTVSPFFAACFELGVVGSLSLFAFVARSDPGKVPPRPREEAIRDIMRSLEAGGSAVEAMAARLPRLCTTTWVVKGARTKYCKMTGACVDEFDH